MISILSTSVCMAFSCQTAQETRAADPRLNEFLTHAQRREAALSGKRLEFVETFARGVEPPFLVECCVIELVAPTEKWRRHSAGRGNTGSEPFPDQQIRELVDGVFPSGLAEFAQKHGSRQIAVFDGGRTLAIEPDPKREGHWVGRRTEAEMTGIRTGGLNCGMLFGDAWLSGKLADFECRRISDEPDGRTRFRFGGKGSADDGDYIEIIAASNDDWYPMEVVIGPGKGHPSSGGSPRQRFFADSLQIVDAVKLLRTGRVDATFAGVSTRIHVRVSASAAVGPFRSDCRPTELEEVHAILDYKDDLTGQLIHCADGSPRPANAGDAPAHSGGTVRVTTPFWQTARSICVAITVGIAVLVLASRFRRCRA